MPKKSNLFSNTTMLTSDLTTVYFAGKLLRDRAFSYVPESTVVKISQAKKLLKEIEDEITKVIEHD